MRVLLASAAVFDPSVGDTYAVLARGDHRTQQTMPHAADHTRPGGTRPGVGVPEYSLLVWVSQNTACWCGCPRIQPAGVGVPEYSLLVWVSQWRRQPTRVDEGQARCGDEAEACPGVSLGRI